MLIAERCKRQMWLTCSWSPMMAGMVSGTQADQNKVASVIREQVEAFEECKKQAKPYWKQVVKRSIVGLVPEQQLAELLKLENWRVTDRVREEVNKRFSIIAQSKVCEDQFCVLRRKEDRQSNKTMAEKQMWRHVIQKKVIDEVHAYEPLQWEQETIPAGMTLERSVFTPPLNSLLGEVKAVMSEKRQGDWFSTNPMGGSIVYADLVQMPRSYRHKDWVARGGLRRLEPAPARWAALLAEQADLRLVLRSRRGWRRVWGWVAGPHDCSRERSSSTRARPRRQTSVGVHPLSGQLECNHLPMVRPPPAGHLQDVHN